MRKALRDRQPIYSKAMNELIDQLSETPRSLAQLAAEVSDEVLDAVVGNSWSPRVVLAHLRDVEFLEMRLAVERMLAEENPALVFLQAEGWAATRNRTRDRKEWLLGEFALQRQASVSILRALRPEDIERHGRIGDRDPMTVRDFVGFWIRHDSAHVAQLEGLLGVTLAEVIERRRVPGS